MDALDAGIELASAADVRELQATVATLFALVVGDEPDALEEFTRLRLRVRAKMQDRLALARCGPWEPKQDVQEAG